MHLSNSRDSTPGLQCDPSTRDQRLVWQGAVSCAVGDTLDSIQLYWFCTELQCSALYGVYNLYTSILFLYSIIPLLGARCQGRLVVTGTSPIVNFILNTVIHISLWRWPRGTEGRSAIPHHSPPWQASIKLGTSAAMKGIESFLQRKDQSTVCPLWKVSVAGR